MDGLVTSVIDAITRHAELAGPVLFILAFGESLAFVGLLFPCTTLMLGAGALIGVGALHPGPVIAWSVAGAVAGDAISYWAGRRFGPNVRRWESLRRQRRTLAHGRLFFRRWGTASIFLGRFLGPLRAIVPLVAGFMRMHQPRFQLMNVVSAFVWVPVMLAPGWLLAFSMEEVGEGQMLAMTAGPALVGGAVSLLAWRGLRRRVGTVAAARLARGLPARSPAI